MAFEVGIAGFMDDLPIRLTLMGDIPQKVASVNLKQAANGLDCGFQDDIQFEGVADLIG
jgi:hypothetical protein